MVFMADILTFKYDELIFGPKFPFQACTPSFFSALRKTVNFAPKSFKIGIFLFFQLGGLKLIIFSHQNCF
jgi:hypothetical protein